jgi:organic hydroperoxide reductase OsmC/OhrA
VRVCLHPLEIARRPAPAGVPRIDQAEFERLATEAERGCPVLKVLAAAEITLEARLV